MLGEAKHRKRPLVPFQLIAAKQAEECHQPAPQVALALAALQEPLPAKSILLA